VLIVWDGREMMMVMVGTDFSAYLWGEGLSLGGVQGHCVYRLFEKGNGFWVVCWYFDVVDQM
jgi:hypothetical protein